MQPTVSFTNAYAAIDYLLAGADAKHSSQAAQVAREEQALQGLGQLARSADVHAASEALEVLMNLAAQGATPTALADRAVKVLSVLHDDAKAPSHLKAAIRQQALALREYTQSAVASAQPSRESTGAAVGAAPATAADSLPAALRSMAALALQDEAAKALHERFKADTDVVRARYAAAAGTPALREPSESAGLRAVTPEKVEQALGGLDRLKVMPRVLTLPQHTSPAELETLEAAVAQLVSLGIEFEEGDDIEAPVRPGVLVLRVAGAQGQSDRWVALLAVPSHDRPGQQDILLLHSAQARHDVFSSNLATWLTRALPGVVAHVAVAGATRPRPMPDDGGLFLAHQIRQFDQALAGDRSHAARKTAAAKNLLDEGVIGWCRQSRAGQCAALATLPGVHNASGPAPVRPPLKAAPAAAWWTRG